MLRAFMAVAMGGELWIILNDDVDGLDDEDG